MIYGRLAFLLRGGGGREDAARLAFHELPSVRCQEGGGRRRHCNRGGLCEKSFSLSTSRRRRKRKRTLVILYLGGGGGGRITKEGKVPCHPSPLLGRYFSDLPRGESRGVGDSNGFENTGCTHKVFIAHDCRKVTFGEFELAEFLPYSFFFSDFSWLPLSLPCGWVATLGHSVRHYDVSLPIAGCMG